VWIVLIKVTCPIVIIRKEDEINGKHSFPNLLERRILMSEIA
jgi:hypothetical protein